MPLGLKIYLKKKKKKKKKLFKFSKKTYAFYKNCSQDRRFLILK